MEHIKKDLLKFSGELVDCFFFDVTTLYFESVTQDELRDFGFSSDETAIKKVISNGGYKKFTNVKEGSLLTIDEKTIEEDAKWDGFMVFQCLIDSRRSFARYRDLWHVEEAFRFAKCTLKTRPIFHWASRRIKTHVLLCFINLFLERFLELLLRQNGNTHDT